MNVALPYMITVLIMYGFWGGQMSMERTLQNATLAFLAGGLGLPVEALRIEAKVEGRPAVFYDQDGATLCVCALDSDYWRRAQAMAVAAAAIDKARMGGNDRDAPAG